MSAGEIVQIEAYPKPPLKVRFPVGQPISDPIDTEGYNLTGMLFPDSWSGGATLTVLVAEKGEAETAWPAPPSEQSAARYRPLFSTKVDFSGTLTQVKLGAAPGEMIALSQIPELKGFRYIKFQAVATPTREEIVWATRVQYVQ